MNPFSEPDLCAPVLALAPMQDITDLPFWRLIAGYGGADVYFTEYSRVHSTSTLDKSILRSVTENPTGRPVFAQMIGNDIPSLVRTARELQEYPIAGVDLNLGCPAPVVYKKMRRRRTSSGSLQNRCDSGGASRRGENQVQRQDPNWVRFAGNVRATPGCFWPAFVGSPDHPRPDRQGNVSR